MAESFFTSGNQMVTTEIDVDSPVTEGWMSKVKGRDVELSDKIVGLGGTGVDGDVTITTNTTLSGIKRYNNFTINAGVTVTIEQGKPLIIFARGTVTINGIIDGDGKGALGGISANSGANGDCGSGGGGGGGYSGAGANGGPSNYLGENRPGGSGGSMGNNNGGAGSSLSNLKRFMYEIGLTGGSGGGAGGIGNTGVSGAGGNGGGVIIIVAPTIIVASGATIKANGANGANGVGGGSASSYGGGGGGGGGLIYAQAKSYTSTGTIQVNFGTGGTDDGSNNGAGGNGGAGVIDVEILP